jgi:hypothetical protein
MDSGAFNTLVTFQKQFSIRNCISFTEMSWTLVKGSTMHSCWHQVWPQVVNYFRGLQVVVKETAEITQLPKEIGGQGFDNTK